MRLVIWRGRVPILSVRRVQRDRADGCSRFETNIRVHHEVIQLLAGDQYLSGSTDPGPVATVARALPETEVDAVSGYAHAREAAVPPVAPRVAVIVAREKAP
jgi:hypothetical protein